MLARSPAQIDMTSLIFNLLDDVEAFFDDSGAFEAGTVEFAPFLVFIVDGDTVAINDVYEPATLLELPDDTPVVGMWAEDYAVEYYHFTVGQYKRHRDQRERRLRTARNVVKVIGPRGGFRSLAYEYTGEQGVTVHVATGIRDEAYRLVAQFMSLGIPITTEKATSGSGKSN